VNCTYITIIEQEHGEKLKDVIKVSQDFKAQGLSGETIIELADGRKKIILTGSQCILLKSNIVIDAIKIIEKAQREDG
jgi:hypothetical protein